MRTLLDTNILLRASQPSSAHHSTSLASVAALLTAGRAPCISSQTVYEFLAVATRSLADNGLGMPHVDADAQLEKLLSGVEVLYDSRETAAALRRLVVLHQVTGKKVHDARLVATMEANGVRELLTFNDADFRRFTNIAVLVPSEVVAGRLPV